MQLFSSHYTCLFFQGGVIIRTLRNSWYKDLDLAWGQSPYTWLLPYTDLCVALQLRRSVILEDKSIPGVADEAAGSRNRALRQPGKFSTSAHPKELGELEGLEQMQ